MSQPTARLAFVATLAAALLAPRASFAQSAGGDGRPDAPLAFAPSAEEGRDVPSEPATEMRSLGAVAGGGVLVSLGGLALIGGVGTMAVDGGESVISFWGGVAAGGGALFLLGGIPLTVWGATNVPTEPEQASAVPSVTVGPTSASARWAF